MFKCIHCVREFGTKNAQAQHTIRCPSNPEKMNLSYLSGGKNFAEYNRKIKAGEIIVERKNQWSDPDYKISEETSKKLSAAGKLQVWSEEQKTNHSDRMKKAVVEHPESYTSSNRGRTKQIIYKGVTLQGGWELSFYKWCESNNIACERNTQGFKYEWKGTRTYYPDFYLPAYDTYVEVKGYKTDRDIAKWSYFPKQLTVIQKQDIIQINNNSYTLPL